jgi:protein O-GlcNAc transferase
LGVSSERIEMRGWISDPLAHLQAYADIDIALDTYPYHGTTTTCEALYMGVPVVTLAGLTHVSRVGVSLITTVGLPQLIASTPDEYVSIASALASDPSRLAAIRSTLRTQIMSSRLVDGLAFASQVEAAYREMWRNWISATLSP